jgi:group I intron endonuclease
MKCYIYIIQNNITNEKYVGQTTNFSRRIQEHYSKLRENQHPNPKLQSSWNKYGEENFSYTKEKFDITKEELDQKEIETIKKENSFENGFNLTEGGTGGNTRGKLTFEQFCFAYFGNKKHEGAMNRTGSYLGVDSSCISALVRGKSYDAYREKAELLSNTEKEEYVKIFEEKLEITDKPLKPNKKNLTDDEIIIFLSLKSWYGRGIEAAYLKHNNLSKGLGYHLKKGEYLNAQRKFLEISDELAEKIAVDYFTTNNLSQYNTKRIVKRTSIERPLCDCAL